MKLYDVTASPNCRKIRVLAREMGLPLTLVPVAFGATSAEHLSANPTGKVPTFVDDDGFSLWESGAILVHLAEKRPELGFLAASGRARADAFRWLFFAANHIQPWVSLLGQERLIKPRTGQHSEPALIALAERELARFLPIVDDALAARDFLTGRYGIADIALGCGFENCEARGIELTRYPNLAAWRERLRARQAWSDPPLTA